jgi:hypothetical protein
MGSQLDNVKNKCLQLSDVVQPTRNAAAVPLRCASIALGKDTEASMFHVVILKWLKRPRLSTLVEDMHACGVELWGTSFRSILMYLVQVFQTSKRAAMGIQPDCLLRIALEQHP